MDEKNNNKKRNIAKKSNKETKEHMQANNSEREDMKMK